MSTAPQSSLDLAYRVRERIRDRVFGRAAELDLELKAVYGLLSLSGARRSLVVPCVAAFTLMDDFSAPASEDDDEAVVQTHTATLAVACAVPATNDPGGFKADTEDKLSPLVAAVRSELLGWPPEGEYVGRELVRTDPFMRRLLGPSDDDLAANAARWRPLRLRRGRLAAIDDGSGRAWWQDEYTTHRLVRGVLPEAVSGSTPDTLCVSVQGDPPELLEEVA